MKGKQLVGPYNTYLDYCTKTFGDKFLDMTTTVRLASAIEPGFRDYYQQKMGIQAATSLEQGIFQRVYPKSSPKSKTKSAIGL